MNRMITFRLFLLLLLLLLDVYIFFVLKAVTHNWNTLYKNLLLIFHVALSLITFLLLFSFQEFETPFRNYIFSLLIAIIIGKVIMGLFFITDDIRRGIVWSGRQIGNSSSEGTKISRSTFISWLGIVMGSAFIGSIIYGFSNKYDYKIHRHTMRFPNLPQSFKGLKILQISDVHMGSLENKEAVSKGIDMILNEKPDLILFTGDLVNDQSAELNAYKNIFSRLKAPLGVYSVLGNHDYGDYHVWDSEEDKKLNLQTLKDIQKEMGWRLLMNEHIVFERNAEKIALLGIENWGAKGRFPKYGKLSAAYTGTENIPFKILLSHDPSHWDAEVNSKYKDIDLMLSGHTHGMQYGIEIGNIKWSPLQFMYDQWGGKYQKGNQVLYVNRGFGFIGYSGRFGILPEITVIELTNK